MADDESESFTDESNRRGDAAMAKLPPRSGNAFVAERDAAGSAAMAQLPPRKKKPAPAQATTRLKDM
jgi:hypothetical protein